MNNYSYENSMSFQKEVDSDNVSSDTDILYTTMTKASKANSINFYQSEILVENESIEHNLSFN